MNTSMLSRQYAHQMVLIDELGRGGVEVLFVNHQLGKRVEIEPEQVKIVYRVDLCPFDRRPERGVLGTL